FAPRIGRPPLRAHGGERGGAFAAESRAGRIVLLTRRTLHALSSFPPRELSGPSTRGQDYRFPSDGGTIRAEVTFAIREAGHEPWKSFGMDRDGIDRPPAPQSTGPCRGVPAPRGQRLRHLPHLLRRGQLADLRRAGARARAAR